MRQAMYNWLEHLNDSSEAISALQARAPHKQSNYTTIRQTPGTSRIQQHSDVISLLILRVISYTTASN